MIPKEILGHHRHFIRSSKGLENLDDLRVNEDYSQKRDTLSLSMSKVWDKECDKLFEEKRKNKDSKQSWTQFTSQHIC